MVATPQHVPGSQYDALAARVAALERQVSAVANKTLFSANIGAGGLSISSGGDLNMGPGGDINLSAGGHIKDGAGNILFSADGTTGQRLSTPFLQVPMTALWDGGTFRSDTTAGDYAIAASLVTTETTLWIGTIPQVLHPAILWSGVVGNITGGSSIPTYRLYINGVLVGTWSQSTYAPFNSPQFDITGVTTFGTQTVQATVTIQASVTSTQNLAFTSYCLNMCGS
jgi:hypothetical protein